MRDRATTAISSQSQDSIRMMNKSTGLFAAGAIALVAMGSSALKCNKHIAGDDYYIDYADDKVTLIT